VIRLVFLFLKRLFKIGLHIFFYLAVSLRGPWTFWTGVLRGHVGGRRDARPVARE
jgi:hypothetical protein